MTGSRVRRWPRMTSKMCVRIATILSTITVLFIYMDVARVLVALSTPVNPIPVKPVHLLPLFDQSLRLARE